MQDNLTKLDYEYSPTRDQRILNFGKGKTFAYDKQATVCDYLEQQVLKTPNAIAVKTPKKELTYQQLNDKANQFAHYLIKKGIQPRDNVAFYLEPSVNVIVSILAILKIGGCYVPLDTNYPLERLNHVLKDSKAKFLITTSKLASHFSSIANLIEIDKCKTAIKKENVDNIARTITADDLAYIIYTSGSTGTPKGIAIHHRAINNHMTWMRDRFNFSDKDVVLLKTPLSFDPSVWEIFLPLFCGAQLIIAPAGANLEPPVLIKIVNHFKVTTIQFVPSLLHEFLKQEKVSSCQSLKRLFSGGETLRTDTKKIFFNKLSCDLINLYGPTEATIDITSHQVTNNEPELEKNIVGKPIYNTCLFVLDAEMKLVNIGMEGELYIGSDNLAKGYFNHPQQTKEKFITNPFNTDKYPVLYKTGDLVRWLDNGTLEYIGRNNDQIKINGVRVEPSELVSYIMSNIKVANCIVAKRMDSKGHAFLACYLVAKENEPIDTAEINKTLKRFFPRYLVPKTYTIMDTFPLTVNGKLDLSALPDPQIHSTSPPEVSTLDNANETEKKLLIIWQTLLKNHHIKLQDNFFEVGGHSILALELISNIKTEFNISIHIKDFFLYPSVIEQANLINSLKEKRSRPAKLNKLQQSIQNSLIPLQTEGNKTPLFLIHPIGGTVFWYSILANQLGNSRPIYGIQDPAIELGKKVFKSIHEMALFYQAMIKKVQPTGPYLIGGASFGATVAVEIANIFQSQSNETIIVPILDGWAIYPHTLRDNNYFKESMRKQHLDLKNEFSKNNLIEPEELFAIQWHRLSLLWKYHLQEIKCPIALFKSQEILPAFDCVNAPLNHWEKFTRQNVPSYVTPGNHETMFQTPHVTKLAELMNQYFDSKKI